MRDYNSNLKNNVVCRGLQRDGDGAAGTKSRGSVQLLFAKI